MYYSAITAAFFLASPFLVAADCTSFENPKIDPNSYSDDFEQIITTLACPSSSQTPCTIPPINDFNLTIPPQFEFFTSGITLSQADNSSIVALASQVYSQYDDQAQAFATHSVILTTSSMPQKIQQEYLSVDPGTNRTLLWVPFFMYATGTLGGCDNSTLNGLDVMVGAAYLNSTNGTGVVTGMWGMDTHNIITTGSTPTTSATTGTTATPSSTTHPNGAPIVTSTCVWSGLLLTLSLLALI